jgi:hemerythrin-like domain-containing protein
MNLTYPVGTIGSVTFLLAATLHQELDRVHCSKASIILFQAIERLGGPVLKEQCDHLERTDLNFAYKSLCEDLLQNLKRQDEVLETRQEEFAEELSQQVTIARQNENIIRQIITDLNDKQDKINTELMVKTQALSYQLAQMSKNMENQSPIPPNIKRKSFG